MKTASTGARQVGGLDFAGGRPTTFLCGEAAAAKRTVAGLVEALGFDAVDCGPLAMLRISMAYAYGRGQGIAFELPRG
jgi:predicted dinucleotide-binding enzyme